MVRGLGKLLFLVGVISIPATMTAGPRVDYTGEWCSTCCAAFCPFDGDGYYSACFPDLGATVCEYNDKHHLWVGGCS